MKYNDECVLGGIPVWEFRSVVGVFLGSGVGGLEFERFSASEIV